MNKRCTNSSCRKTFSTLINGGTCPFCGKVYPQLIRAGYSKAMKIWIGGKRIRFGADVVESYRMQGQRVKGILACKREFERLGYTVSLRAAMEFYDSLDSKQYLIDRWREIADSETEDKEIVPVYSDIEHRFYVRSLRYLRNETKLLSSCKDRGMYYGLTNEGLIIDGDDKAEFIWLSSIKNAQLIGLPPQESMDGSKCLQVTFYDPGQKCVNTISFIGGFEKEFTAFAESVQARSQSL